MVESSTSTNPNKETGRKDRSKVYFFVIAVLVILVTNFFFYLNLKSSDEKLYTITLQKEDLQREIDRVEAELDNVRSFNDESFSDKLIQDENTARNAILDLREQLDDVNLTEAELDKAKLSLQQLKGQVVILKEESSQLRMQYEILKSENDSLSVEVLEKSSELKVLKDDNLDLNNKVAVASSIKVSNFLVNGVTKNKSGIYEVVVKAKKAKELQIKFSVVDNELSKIGDKDVYVRIIDPKGNLIANSSNVFDLKNGRVLQYTFKERIIFTNNGEEYEFIWSTSDSKYMKGAYTVLLYSDGAIMGRSSVVFK